MSNDIDISWDFHVQRLCQNMYYHRSLLRRLRHIFPKKLLSKFTKATHRIISWLSENFHSVHEYAFCIYMARSVNRILCYIYVTTFVFVNETLFNYLLLSFTENFIFSFHHIIFIISSYAVDIMNYVLCWSFDNVYQFCCCYVWQDLI